MIINEAILERYVIDASSLSTDEVRSIEEKIAADPEVSAAVERLRSFYDELSGIPEQVPDAVQAFSDRLIPKRGTSILHFVDADEDSEPDSLLHATAMAAQSTPPSGHRHLGTFVSDDGSTGVRLLADPEERLLRLFLLKKPESGLVLVRFPERGILAVTDANGRATVNWDGSFEPHDWQDATCEIQTAVLLAGFAVRKKGRESMQASGYEVELCWKRGSLEVILSGEGTDAEMPSQAVLWTPDWAVRSPIADGLARFEIPEEVQRIRLSLFV